MRQILIVEDSEADRYLLLEAFNSVGETAQVSMVEDGIAALHFLKRTGDYKNAPRPDLILLDLNLPKKDGFEVLDEIKSNEALMSIPVAILSSSKSPSDICNSYRMNANCYLAKPSRFSELVEMIKSLRDFWFHQVTYCASN